ncbi:MAG: hypothetical protein AVDCRST_MAG83-1421, partial [uncultured Arthrobacter sp.]
GARPARGSHLPRPADGSHLAGNPRRRPVPPGDPSRRGLGQSRPGTHRTLGAGRTFILRCPRHRFDLLPRVRAVEGGVRRRGSLAVADRGAGDLHVHRASRNDRRPGDQCARPCARTQGGAGQRRRGTGAQNADL